MGDEVQQYLTSETETLRSETFRAGALDARRLGQSAELHIGNVLRFVVISPELEEATFLAVSHVAILARALYGQAEIREIEQARRNALLAIDTLAIVLARAQRSDTADFGAHHGQPAAENRAGA